METRAIALLSAGISIIGTALAGAALHIGLQEREARELRGTPTPIAVQFCDPDTDDDPMVAPEPMGCTPASFVVRALRAEGYLSAPAAAIPMPIAPVKGLEFKPAPARPAAPDIMASIEEDRRIWAELGVAQAETERVRNSVDELAMRIDKLERRQGM